MKHLIYSILIACSVFSVNAYSGITGTQALESASSNSLNNSDGFNGSSVYASLPLESGSGQVHYIEGICYPGGPGGSRNCHIASGRNWYCSMSGGRAIGEGEVARVYLSGSNWYAFISRGGWPGELRWSCYSKN